MIQYSRKKQANFLARAAALLQHINLVTFCVVSVTVLLVWGGILWLSDSHFKQYFKFHHVKLIMDARHIEPHALAERIASHLNGGFFALDTEKLSRVIKQDPWIKEVTLRRVWPDTLKVTVIEQMPIARWNRTALINSMGEIFTPPVKTFPNNLLHLAGPQGGEQEVLMMLNHYKPQLLEVGAKITGLALNSRNAWQMEINSQFKVMLGQKDLDTEMKRFIVLYSEIIALNEDKTVSVDMRYPNGAAIKWK